MMRVTKQFEHLKIQLESIISATNNFADENCVGKGGFGKVYKGELVYSKGQTVVAIKRLNRSFGQGDPEFWKEIIMLSRYKHENIVSLLGFCDESGEKILVYEYASNKSLDLHLNSNDLTWIQRLKICIGAARGLAYLHDYGTTQQRTLHRDIKSSNILLDETWNARISDFGLSKFAPANQQISFMISNRVGTIGYCDPIYAETGLLTKESDVYSFGVVLFEVLCGRLCIGDKNDKHPPLIGLARHCYKQNKLNEIIYGNIKDEINSDSLKAFSTIAYQCLKRDIEERPLMAKVVRVLESALEHQEEEENSKPRDAYTIVEIIEASDMRFADLYVKGQLGPHKFRTKPQKKTSSPKWLEEFRIPIHTWESRDVQSMILKIEIWDTNFYFGDILISDCSISINDFKDGRRHDMWMPLQNISTGRLHLAITIVEVDIKEEEENSKPRDAYTIVEIIEASDMRLADPYVKGQLGPYKFRTKPQKKTSSPKWLEEFRIPIHTWESRNVLMIEIWDKNFFIDDILSNCSITINDFKDGQRHDIWVPLQNVTAGRLHLAITVVEVDIKGAAVPEAEVAGETGRKLVYFEGTMGFTADDLMCATAEIMGISTYGTVYKATLEDGDQVAVKRLREKITKDQREFEIEVNLLGKIRHPNLLAMRAYYFDPKGEKFLVFDYMPKGSLATFLHARGPETPVDWPTRMQIMKGMAQGLLSLHNHHNIIHGNLTSSNILLDENINPKIADFGLLRLMTAAANSNVIAIAGALGYRAPELSKLKKANTKTDIYSVGVIMLELLTGKSPGEAMNGVDLLQWVASIVKEEWTNEVFDLELMKDASAIGDELLNTLKLALHCVDPSPSERPEVQLVLQQLEEIRPETATSSGDDGGAGPSMNE